MARCIEEKKHIHTQLAGTKIRKTLRSSRVADDWLQLPKEALQPKKKKKNQRLICKQVQVLIELAFLANYKQVSVTALPPPPQKTSIHGRLSSTKIWRKKKKKTSGTAESLCCGWGGAVSCLFSLYCPPRRIPSNPTRMGFGFFF